MTTRRTSALIGLAVALLAGACNGMIDTPYRPGPERPSTRLDCTDAPEPGAPVPMRRLTRFQLETTVRDVFGMDVVYLLADEHLLGYRSNVSSGLDMNGARTVQTVAEQISTRVAPAVAGEAGCLGDCAQHVIDRFGERLFRRPLDADTRARFAALYAQGYAEGGTQEGVRWIIEALLQSPRFLYLTEATSASGRLEGYSIASRLSYALWAGPPDEELLAAAASGELDTDEGILASAERMIDDPRFERGLDQFVTQWLQLDELEDALVRPDIAELEAPVREALRREPVLFVTRNVREGGSLEELLTSATTTDLPALQQLYGDDIVFVDVESGRVELDPAHRAGLLTMPAVLAALSHVRQTSPTRRGRAVLASLLCDPPPPPPPGVVPSLPPAEEGVSTRERLETHFSNDGCASCHRAMDGIGFTFEHFDYLGQWREAEGVHPIDATASFAIGYDEIRVDGATELAAVLAERREVADCVARHWTRYAAGVVESPELACTIQSLADDVEAGGLRSMILSFVTSSWFVKPSEGEM
ncbi:MAG: DUF1592 domain-containing protein [Sandaracinaceae bacterium]